MFPDGRYVLAWTRWLALVMLVYWAAVASFPSWKLDQSMLSLVIFLSFVLATIVLQFYRYRYISTPQQRQQTKWAMFGVSIAVAGNILPRLLYFVLFPLTGGSSLMFALEVCLIMGSMLAIPFIHTWYRRSALSALGHRRRYQPHGGLCCVDHNPWAHLRGPDPWPANALTRADRADQ